MNWQIRIALSVIGLAVVVAALVVTGRSRPPGPPPVAPKAMPDTPLPEDPAPGIGLEGAPAKDTGAKARFTIQEETDQKALKRLLSHVRGRPPSMLLVKVSAADREPLLQRYAETRDLVKQRPLTWALGYVGDERAVEALKETLSRDRAKKEVSLEEEAALLETVLALGFLASHNDDAYRFVRQGVDLDRWQGLRTWASPRRDFSSNMLVYYSLQAIGISGRPEAREELLKLKERPPGYLYDFGSSIAQAAFHLDVIDEHGMDYFRAHYFTPGDRSLYKTWASGRGREWVAWANATRRGKRPE